MLYRDIESNETITKEQLKSEYLYKVKTDPEYESISFSEFIENCMWYNNGSLKKVYTDMQDFFNNCRRPKDFDSNGNPIF